MWHDYVNALSVEQVLHLLSENRTRARIAAGQDDDREEI
mgnify:CR=1 FL=1